MNEHKPMARRINLLASILIAFASWYFVVYNYAPVKTVTYKNVPVSFIGADTLAQSGLAISSTSLKTINVTLNVKRVEFNKVSSDDISVQADVSNAVEGDNGVSLNVTPPGDATFVRASASSMSVEVESGTSKTVDVAEVYGSIDTDFEPVPTYVSSEEVSVFGTEEQLKQVSHVVLQLPYSDSDNKSSHTLTPVAVDSTGNPIDNIVVRPSDITVQAKRGTTKVVLLKLVVKDISNLKKTYKAVDRVVIKGPADVLDKITEIETKPIDLTYITKNTDVPLVVDAPDGVMLSVKSIDEKVHITIDKK